MGDTRGRKGVRREGRKGQGGGDKWEEIRGVAVHASGTTSHHGGEVGRVLALQGLGCSGTWLQRSTAAGAPFRWVGPSRRCQGWREQQGTGAPEKGTQNDRSQCGHGALTVRRPTRSKVRLFPKRTLRRVLGLPSAHLQEGPQHPVAQHAHDAEVGA